MSGDTRRSFLNHGLQVMTLSVGGLLIFDENSRALDCRSTPRALLLLVFVIMSPDYGGK